jgi:peptidoglycan/LPS O-acetylase OafA/YrhL
LADHVLVISGKSTGEMTGYVRLRVYNLDAVNVFIMVMTASQFVLLRFWPGLPRDAHFWIMFAATVGGTILVSAIPHRFVEAPGNQLGRELAARLRKPSPDTLTAVNRAAS